MIREIMNKSVRPMLVAKISSDLIPNCFDGWEPILNDCFLLSWEAKENLAVYYQGEVVKPQEGSKFIGAYRDKGSISGVLSRFLPFCYYRLNDKEEVANFCELLKNLNKGYYIKEEENTVIFQLDVIADVSVGRDNVTSLLGQSCLDLKANIEGIDLGFTQEELDNLDVEELLNNRSWDHRVVIIDSVTKSIVYDFGECAILLEDYFWQPSHDNSLVAGEKEISFSYHQMKDGMAVLTPTLYKTFMASIDFTSLKEDMLLTGIEVQEMPEGLAPEGVTNISSVSNENEDDLLA
jgi:hypothetical protein